VPPDSGFLAYGAPDRETTPPLSSSRRRGALGVVGLASLANGVALVLHIIGGLPLGGLLAVVWLIAAVAIGAIGFVGGPSVRAGIVRTVAVGLAVGLTATLLYDATKALLSQLDPTPYDPFETTRVFGRILIGAGAPTTAIAIVGWAFHLINGSTFAIAFACLFARGGRIRRGHGAVAGVGDAFARTERESGRA
jgi:hypothetical protein